MFLLYFLLHYTILDVLTLLLDENIQNLHEKRKTTK